MFDFLKKKISGFINGITGRKEAAAEERGGAEKPEKEKEAAPAAGATAESAGEMPAKSKKEEPAEKAKAAGKREPPKKGEKPQEKIMPSLSVATALKSIITGEIEISEADVGRMLDSLELELIEGDVEIETAAALIADLRNRLVGSKVAKSELNAFIKKQTGEALRDALTTGREFSLVERVHEGGRPFKIVFVGINGAGKTTTIAKVASVLMKNGFRVVFAAADTFRAAAIEQLDIHASRLGVKTIKKDYGSDPASVAFDAVNYARAHGIDVVLIDTAGRQETNASLMNELKKIDRVIKPDLKLYIGESIGGTAVLEQIKSFNSEVGIDGIILTKLDCDAKGGTILSAAKVTSLPIVMVGVGQKYDDIEEFQPQKIIERLLA